MYKMDSAETEAECLVFSADSLSEKNKTPHRRQNGDTIDSPQHHSLNGSSLDCTPAKVITTKPSNIDKLKLTYMRQ